MTCVDAVSHQAREAGQKQPLAPGEHAQPAIRMIFSMEDHMNSKFSLWRSLKTRVTLLTLGIFALGFVCLSFYANRLLRADMQQVLGEQQFQAVSVIANQVNVELKDRQVWLDQVASEIDAQMMGNPTALQAYLEKRIALFHMFNGGAWVAGLDGVAIADVPSSAQRLGVNYMNVDFIASVLKDGKPVISRPVIGKKLLTPVVAMTVAIRDDQGRVIGVMSGVTDLGKPTFLDKITQGHFGKTGGYLLVAPHHQLIVTASDKTRVMQPVPAPGVNTMYDRIRQGYEGFGVAVNSRGVEELSATKGIPVAGWLLVAVVPTAEAFAPSYAMQRRMLLATLLLSLLTGAMTWWILKRQLTPLVATADAMVALADSNQMTQPLTADRHDEIGDLVDGFNRILQTWRQREEVLKDSQQNLAITLDSIGDAVVATDAQGLITRMNPVAERLTGWPLADAAGQPLTEVFRIISAQTRLATPDPVQQVMACGDVVGMTSHTTLLARDGLEYHVNASAAPIRNAANDIVGMVLVFSDVSEKYRVELALKESEQRYHSLLENFSSGVVVHRADTTIVLANAMAAQLLGLTQDQMLGKAAFDPDWCFVREDGTIMPLEEYPVNRVLSSGEPLRNSVGGVHHSGRTGPTWVICNAYAQHDAEGNLVQVVVTFTDITERKRAEDALKQSEERWQFALESGGDGLWDWNLQTGEAFFSPRYKQMLGYAEHEFENSAEGWSKRIHPDDAAGVMTALQPYLDGKAGAASIEFRMLCKDGSWMWTLGRGKVIGRDASGKGTRMIGTNADITERKHLEEQVRQLAYFDPLTQLPNRRMLDDRLGQTMALSKRSGRHTAVMVLDLDNFKSLNDLHGHLVGDLLLVEVARRLLSCVRAVDTVARFGGDEFVVVLSELDVDKAESSAQARVIAEKIRASLSAKYVLTLRKEGGTDMTVEHHCSASIGVVLSVNHETPQADILRWADAAMYQAKDAGRNAIRFYETNCENSTD